MYKWCFGSSRSIYRARKLSTPIPSKSQPTTSPLWYIQRRLSVGWIVSVYQRKEFII
nr:MAG TPA: hypothetical protein [Caudoviricetes sp.]